MKSNEMMKTAKMIDVVLRVCQALVIAAGVVCLIGLLLISFFPGMQDILLSVQYGGELNLGAVSLDLVSSAADKSTLIFSLTASILLALVLCAAAWYGLSVLIKIMAPIKEGRPFEAGTGKQLNKFAWLILIIGTIGEAAQYFLNVYMLKAFDLAAMFNSSVVSGFTYNFNFDGSYILMAAFVELLSLVFLYGEHLQKESDETL